MRLALLKRKLLGSPLRTAEEVHERLSKVTALAIFSSDALSSVAYATEEILLVLVLAGLGWLHLSLPIALGIAALLVIVVTSYRQTIHAYPSGGGAYIVAKDNLGAYPGLIAAAALLIDYVLTVAVSVAAGVAAITSAFPTLYSYRVVLGLLAVFLITFANLRGVRASGRIFAVPTYLFIVSFFAMIVTGLAEALLVGVPEKVSQPEAAAVQGLTLFLILRAFASGCTALTGVEAISDGVPAFKPPEAKNASTTLSWMGVILLTLFLGVTILAYFYGVIPREGETVVSQLARRVFEGNFFYYVVQAATAMILVLAANTSFADFPRLAYFLARDRFLPAQLANRGDRLVFSNGIIILGLAASSLIFLFGGSTHALIPLYAVGVFLSFTLSQAGMVRRWLIRKDPGWKKGVWINGMGALATGVVMVVIATTKFVHGAWIVILCLPLLVLMFLKIHDHYLLFTRQVAVEGFEPPKAIDHTVLVPVPGLHRGVLTALEYARSLSPKVEAVYVDLDVTTTEALLTRWDQWANGIPLVILDSPYRSVVGPLVEYIGAVQGRTKQGFVTVILPEVVPARGWHFLLHNQTAWFIKAALLFKKRVIIVDVPYHLER